MAMQEQLLALIENEEWLRTAASAWREGRSVGISGLTKVVKTTLLCALKEAINPRGALVLLAANREELRSYRRELNYFYPLLPIAELYPESLVSGSIDRRTQELMAERLAALETIYLDRPGVVFVTAEAFQQKLPAPNHLLGNGLYLETGLTVEEDFVCAELLERGYERVDQVDALGQFTVRGDIVDVFPINANRPVRIEWFDCDIDAIRSFDLVTQRSVEELGSLEIAPLTIGEGSGEASLFAFTEKNRTPVILDEPLAFFTTLENLEKDNREYADRIFTAAAQEEECRRQRLINIAALNNNYFPRAEHISLPLREITSYNKNTEVLLQDLRRYLADGVAPLIQMGNTEKAKSLSESLRSHGLPVTYREEGELLLPGCITVFSGDLGRGFRFWDAPWVLICEGDILGMQKQRRLKRNKQAGPSLQYFTEIKTGDYVVHEVHGIGRYEGVKTIEVDGVHRDYLHVAYAGDDKLYVPVEQVGLLHKYIGNEGQAPRLSRMGGVDWSRVKGRAQKAITEMAEELLRLYARRKVTEGHAFAPDTPWQKEFEESFPFEETPDQLQAIKEVKADMEKPEPMERLLCGDVGYGKTEVAVRAAFKAVMDGKQVAVLAPTTVLAQQHLMTFRQRMDAFGVRIEMLSRFRTPAEQKKILHTLEDGQVDILIGTHRLLQADVHFPDLGLLIIDEEQRFGVAQKEKIKKWMVGIDVLSLSATPIPRTLHLALVKGRDMSVIESPPEDRLPVETCVAEYDEEMVKEAIEREIRRGGRVYYVHNRVQGLDSIATRLRELIPGISIRIAHGQMPEELLEDAMVGFYEGEFDVLLCTTIIENGLDVPLANTIIIDGAEYFGLSQLYQMRGRVGRSSRLAYAYFLYKKDRALNEVAQKRLQAIRDFTELGAGFQIAMRDLEIRGAGNILGAQQHGHIAGIGFAAYCHLLEQTIDSLQNASPREVIPDPVLELTLDAYIPEEYIDDPRYKMELYRKASELEYSERGDFLDEIIDRFGTPPPEVLEFVRVAALRALCRELGITGIAARGQRIFITFSRHTLCDPALVVRFVEENAPLVRLREKPETQLIIDVWSGDDILEYLEQTLLAFVGKKA